MPYYVFKIQSAELAMLKQLELLTEFDNFKQAKNFAKAQRAEQAEGDNAAIKVMFAENLLSAEEQLMEKRVQPIVMEHEK
jgi:hypothetical protein